MNPTWDQKWWGSTNRIPSSSLRIQKAQPYSHLIFQWNLKSEEPLCQSCWGRVIGGGDANDWLIGVNWLRRKEEYRESYWKVILSKLPQMASESKGLRLQTQAFFLGESHNNSPSQKPSLKFPWLYLTEIITWISSEGLTWNFLCVSHFKVRPHYVSPFYSMITFLVCDENEMVGWHHQLNGH